MKQPKPLTREQKVCVSAHRLNPKKWALIKETEFYLKIIHKETKTIRTLDKFRR